MEPYSLALLEGKRTRYIRDRLGRFAPTSGALAGRAGVVDVGETIKTPKGALDGVVGTAHGRSTAKTAFALGALGTVGGSAALHANAHAAFYPNLVRGVRLTRRARAAKSKALQKAGMDFVKKGGEHLAIAAGLGVVAAGSAVLAKKVYAGRDKSGGGKKPGNALSAIARGAGSGAKHGAIAGLGGALAVMPANAAYMSYHGSSKKLAIGAAAANAAMGALYRPIPREGKLTSAPALVTAGALGGSVIGAARGYRNYKKNRVKESGVEPYSLALLEGKRTKYARDRLGRFASTGVAAAKKFSENHKTTTHLAKVGAVALASEVGHRVGGKVGGKVGGAVMADMARRNYVGLGRNREATIAVERYGGQVLGRMVGAQVGTMAGKTISSNKLAGVKSISPRATPEQRAAHEQRQGEAARLYLQGTALRFGARSARVMAGSPVPRELGRLSKNSAKKAYNSRFPKRVPKTHRLGQPSPTIDIGKNSYRIKESDMELEPYSLELLEGKRMNQACDKLGRLASKGGGLAGRVAARRKNRVRESFAPHSLALLENAKMGYPEQGIPPAAATAKKPMAAKSGLKRKKMAKVATAVAA